MSGLPERQNRGSNVRSKYLCRISLSVDKSVDNLWISTPKPVDKSVDNPAWIFPVDNPASYPQVIHRERPLIHNFIHRTKLDLDVL